jgi:curved DNA-binding protein CbpA
MSVTDSAFSILGIQPTLDLGAIKRGYFARLPQVSPERDPDGFRRLRDAYEALLKFEGRALAFVRAPIESREVLSAELSDLTNETITKAANAAELRAGRTTLVSRFTERMSSLSFSQAVTLAKEGR